MTTTPRTKTFVMPDMADRFPPNGNPPDGYVLTFQAADGYYIARVPAKILGLSSPNSSPYSIVTEDAVLVQSHVGTFTVNLPIGPLPGTVIYIKDFAGVATLNQINVATVELVDGANPYIINNNFGSIRVVYNGATWSVLSKF